LPYATLADVVVYCHFLWIVFVLIGGWWGRRHRFIGRLHIASLVWGLLVEGCDWYCPLTHLEVWLRERGAQAGYQGSFLSHYLNQLIYIEVPHGVIVALTVLLCLANAWLYRGAGRRRA